MILKKVQKLTGELNVPGDKSISHRSIMLGSLAKGTTEINNFLNGADCLSTISCFQSMGISIELDSQTVKVHGNGLYGLKKPVSVLDVGNSGTTTRLMSGILAAQNFNCSLTGDSSIQKRPMNRIMIPLQKMGAKIESINHNECAPLHIRGTSLHGICFHSPIASAQVKSCILLAGLYADSETSVTEPYISRNHTEIMLRYFGGNVTINDTTATIQPHPELTGKKIMVPGDISSAAYFICAGLIVLNSEILIKNTGINPTRDGIIKIVKMMGGDITLINKNQQDGEPSADILVRSSNLTGCEISGNLIPSLIDEIPVIAVLAAYANGITTIKDAQELKVKESNRIDTVVNSLQKMGASITATNDGMIIHGGKPLHGTTINSHNDHRIAMSFSIAALQADGNTTITDENCINISYPNFYKDLNQLCH